jgi:predicted nucleic acid-binding protein
LSTQVLAEFFWVATRKLARPVSDDLAAQVVARLARYRVVGADSHLVLAAIDLAREHRLTLWDALIVRAAQVGRCERLLTEDLQDGSVFGGVVVENPFRALTAG